MAGVHIGLVMPLVYAGVLARLSGVQSRGCLDSAVTLAPAVAGVYAQRAYVARAFAHRAVSLASLSVRLLARASRGRLTCCGATALLMASRALAAAFARQLGSMVTFAWLVALKPKKKVD